MSEILVAPHTAVERTERSLRGAKKDERGLVRSKAKGCLNVTVSPAQIDRAMRIMDAVVKAIEARGYQLSTADEPGQSTKVTVRDETITIRL